MCAKKMLSLGIGMFLVALATPTLAATTHLWIPLNTADSAMSIDYNSIRLEGTTPTVLLKQHFTTPIVAGDTTIKNIIHQYSVDCANQVLVRESSRSFDDQNDSAPGAAVKVPASNDKIAIGPLKSICVWHDHGFKVPDISISGSWDEMDSPVSTERVFEAPARRQKKDGFVLITVKNEETPDLLFNGVASHYGVGVVLYDCEKREAHSTIAVRYDQSMKPLLGGMYEEHSSMPKLEVNRDRFASTCQ